jgi:hypothetical protein
MRRDVIDALIHKNMITMRLQRIFYIKVNAKTLDIQKINPRR